jgi:hypothetical protein
MRRLEFSMFDRKMLSLDDETFAVSAAKRLPKKAFTPRQHALLDGIGKSVCGFFVVRERQSQTTVLEHIGTNARYEIREYNLEHEYDEGWVIAGRLIPLPEIGWIRSPGTIVYSVSDRSRSALTELRLEAKTDAYPSIVVELEMAIFDRENLPRLVRPAPSRKDAERMLHDFHESALESGLARERPDATALLPEVVSKMAGPDVGPHVGVVDTRVDDVLGQWIAALREQAGRL